MTNDECRMTNVPPDAAPATRTARDRSRWLLAIVDGVWAWGCLSLGYLTVSFLLRLFVCELDRLNSDVVLPPPLTMLLVNVLPEPGFALVIGVSLLSVAYARLSYLAQDSITTRLFRWSLGLFFGMLMIVALPLLDMLNPWPRMLEDRYVYDEVAFLLFTSLAAVLPFVIGREKPRRDPS